MEPEKIVQILDELTEQARCAESAYRAAAADADELSLTAFSVSCAAVCGDRADELENISILYRTGHKPLRHYLAPFAEAWEWLSNCWRRRDDIDIVEACKRREDASFRAYENALGKSIPGNLRLVLQHHFDVIKQSQAGFRRLRLYYWQLANKGEPITTQAEFHASGT